MAESPKNAAAAATEAATQENSEEVKKHDVEYADEEAKNAVSIPHNLNRSSSGLRKSSSRWKIEVCKRMKYRRAHFGQAEFVSDFD